MEDQVASYRAVGANVACPAEIGVGADSYRAAAEHRALGIRVATREDQVAGPLLNQLAHAVDRAAVGERIGAGEDQRLPVVVLRQEGHIAGNAPRRSATADLQRSAVDRSTTGVGVIAGEDERARAGLGHAAVTADGPAVRGRVRTVEDQLAVVEHVPGDHAGVSTGVDLQGPVADRRSAGVGVAGQQRRHAAAVLCQAARTADRAGKRGVVRVIEDQHAVVDRVARHAARRATIA